jgi:hypothetical protein
VKSHMSTRLHGYYQLFCPILIKPEFSRDFRKNIQKIKFHTNTSSGSPAVPWGRADGPTDVSKLTVAYPNFANANKNESSREGGLLRETTLPAAN